jgi:hypothetical protein
MFMTRPLFVTLSWFLHPCSEPPLSRLRTNLPIFFLCLNFFCNSRYNYRKYFGESKILRLTYSYKNISFFQNWSVTRTIQRASRFLGQGRFLEETLTVLWKSRRSHGQVMLNLIKPGGLNLSWSCLDWDSQSRHWQRAGLDSWENLNTFRKLVSTIEIFWFSLDGHMQIQFFSVKIKTYPDLWRVWRLVIICNFFVDFWIFF